MKGQATVQQNTRRTVVILDICVIKQPNNLEIIIQEDHFKYNSYNYHLLLLDVNTLSQERSFHVYLEIGI